MEPADIFVTSNGIEVTEITGVVVTDELVGRSSTMAVVKLSCCDKAGCDWLDAMEEDEVEFWCSVTGSVAVEFCSRLRGDDVSIRFEWLVLRSDRGIVFPAKISIRATAFAEKTFRGLWFCSLCSSVPIKPSRFCMM